MRSANSLTEGPRCWTWCWAPNEVYRAVLTGGPGAGKTTVLAVLNKDGYSTGQDAARSIIRDRKASGLPPRPLPAVFAEQILERDIASYRSPARSPVFFERGVVEAAALLVGAGGLNIREAGKLIAEYRYDRVFIFPPWEEVYCTDEERDHTFEHSVRVYESTRDWYLRHDYPLIDVPFGSPEMRSEFILAHMEGASMKLKT